MITRESYLLWLGLVATLVTYLISAAKSPLEWSYLEWLQAAAFILAWVIGKLQSSPLKGNGDPK